MNFRAARNAVLDAARRLLTLSLTHGTSGNVSTRVAAGLAITPTGVPVDDLAPEDIVILSDDGVPHRGERRAPSSEWRMHAAIYQARPEVRAIVHGHSPAATAVACLGREIPPFHYMIAIAGGDSIRCARYATFGTDQLARYAVDALVDRQACLLARHGMLALGSDLDRALSVAEEVEFLSDLYLRLLPLGPPALLSREDMEAVLEGFRQYGQPAAQVIFPHGTS